jgi:hypothetical protein
VKNIFFGSFVTLRIFWRKKSIMFLCDHTCKLYKCNLIIKCFCQRKQDKFWIVLNPLEFPGTKSIERFWLYPWLSVRELAVCTCWTKQFSLHGNLYRGWLNKFRYVIGIFHSADRLLRLSCSFSYIVCNAADSGNGRLPLGLKVWKTTPFVEDILVSGTEAVKLVS